MRREKETGGAVRGETKAAAFLAGLACQAKREPSTGDLMALVLVDVVNLEQAAARLSERLDDAWCAWARARGRGKARARATWQTVRDDVKRAIDVSTRGAAYRFDTPHGPLFEFNALFAAAGRVGPFRGENAGEPFEGQGAKAVA